MNASHIQNSRGSLRLLSTPPRTKTPVAGIPPRGQISRTSAPLHFWRSTVFGVWMLFIWVGRMHIYHETSTHADVDICLPNNFSTARSPRIAHQNACWLPDLLLFIWNTFMMHFERKCTGDKIHISTNERAKTTSISECLNISSIIVLSKRRLRKTISSESAQLSYRIYDTRKWFIKLCLCLILIRDF